MFHIFGNFAINRFWWKIQQFSEGHGALGVLLSFLEFVHSELFCIVKDNPICPEGVGVGEWGGDGWGGAHCAPRSLFVYDGANTHIHSLEKGSVHPFLPREIILFHWKKINFVRNGLWLGQYNFYSSTNFTTQAETEQRTLQKVLILHFTATTVKHICQIMQSYKIF